MDYGATRSRCGMAADDAAPGGRVVAGTPRTEAVVSGVLWLYGVLSLFVLGHYFYASPTELSFRINFLIGMEAVAAALLLLSAPFLVPRRVN